jgi:hypothetical protein
MDWTRLAVDTAQQRALVKMVMNLLFPYLDQLGEHQLLKKCCAVWS